MGAERTPQPTLVSLLAVDAAGIPTVLPYSRSAWLKQCAAGRTPRPVRIGGRVLWPIDELRDWLAAGAPERGVWESLKAEREVRT